VSVFDLSSSPPTLASRSPSGGTRPVSVTAHDGLVYVLNAGGDGNVSGFRVDRDGALHAIAGGTSPLSRNTPVTPTQVSFSPDGDTLVVTEKDTALIDTYYVDVEGRAHGPTLNPSDGATPFGFGFSGRRDLVVSEAAGSAASSYDLRGEVYLQSISASVANGQAAACWLAVSPDGRHAFTANAGSGNLSSYRIGEDGQLSLEAGVAGQPGAHPIDMAFAARGSLLLSLANGAGTITVFRVDGAALTGVGSVGSLPTSATGLVAR
jgi:6-phosphogluconolactonase